MFLLKSFEEITKQFNEISADSAELKNNKWSREKCGKKLIISEDALRVQHLTMPFYELNSVRAEMAIGFKRFNFCYFEVEILKKQNDFYGIRIGYCDEQFPLEGVAIGGWNNSIGIYGKEDICIDGCLNSFANSQSTEYFREGNVIGCGLWTVKANSSIKCFATLNGTFLGSIQLPSKFAGMQLFPALTLFCSEDSVRANFGADFWHFDPSLNNDVFDSNEKE